MPRVRTIQVPWHRAEQRAGEWVDADYIVTAEVSADEIELVAVAREGENGLVDVNDWLRGIPVQDQWQVYARISEKYNERYIDE